MSKPAKLRVVIVEPGQYAREAEIDNTLEAEQAVVGGLIDVICPWPDDKACLILNDEGKLIPLEVNRDCPNMRTWCLAPSLSAAMAERIFVV